MTHMPQLIEPQGLLEILGESTFVFDASWVDLPCFGDRNADTEFQRCRIPGAVRFDIDFFSDPTNPAPHMLPSTEDFISKLSGICRFDVSGRRCEQVDVQEAQFVLYDNNGMFSSPRAAWILETFGASQVFLLNGGLPAWVAAGLGTEKGVYTPPKSEGGPAPAIRSVKLDKSRVWSFQDVSDYVACGGASDPSATHKYVCLLDGRPAKRFSGEVPEPRPGIPRGHIPTAMNVPFDKVLEIATVVRPKADFGKLSPNEIRFTTSEPPAIESDEVFQEYWRFSHENARAAISGVVAGFRSLHDGHINEEDISWVVYCGSGITACILWLALTQVFGLASSHVVVYDGSWTEYALQTAKS